MPMKFTRLIEFLERLEATTKRLEMFDILSEQFAEASPSDVDRIIYLVQGQLGPSFRGIELGISSKLLMRALMSASGLSQKKVSALYTKHGDLGLVAERVMESAGDAPPASLFDMLDERRNFESVTAIHEVLLEIAQCSGPGSQERKIGLLIELLRGVPPLAAKYVARIILGKLRLGVGDPTILEALALSRGDRAHKTDLERAYNLCSDLGLVATTLFKKGLKGVRAMHITVGYPVRMALCERLASADEILAKLGKAAVEYKYDGFRVQIHMTRKSLEMYSRNLERTTDMFPEIGAAVRKHVKASSLIIEGEAMASDENTGQLLPFQTTIQRKRKHGVDEMAQRYPLRFFAFDLLYLDGEDWTERPFIERRRGLEKVIGGNTVIQTSDLIITDRPEEITRMFGNAVDEGFEGLVIKRLDSVYAAGSRNFNWIKLKPSYRHELSDSVDVCIVGYFYGKGARARFGIGGVLGAVYDSKEDVFKTITKIGSGFTEDELKGLKALLDESRIRERHARVQSEIEPDVWVEPRYVIAVTADELTRSPLHTAGRRGNEPGYALRFPRFVGALRTDKKPEDATSVKEIVRLYKMQKNIKSQ